MKSYLFSFFLVFPSVINSQLIRKVVDINTNLPVPFATIKVLNKPKGLVASEKGEFNLLIDKSDSILITSVGYHDAIITGDKAGTIIYLAPKIKTLADVKIGTKEIVRTLLVGNKNMKFKETDNWGPVYSNLKEEIAQKIELPDSSRAYRIKKIFIPSSKIRCWGNILVHVYTINSLTTEPGEEIFMTLFPVTEENIRKKQIEIEINSPNLLISDSKYFFVSVSWPEDAYGAKCLTVIVVSKDSDQTTYIRRLSSEKYNWFDFGKFKNSSGVMYKVSTRYSALIEELR